MLYKPVLILHDLLVRVNGEIKIELQINVKFYRLVPSDSSFNVII